MWNKDKQPKDAPTGIEGNISFFARNLEDIRKIVISVIIIASLGYTAVDWLGTKFVTKLDAKGYALKESVSKIDHNLAKTQSIVLSNELYNARKAGINPEDKAYLRTLDKRKFLLQIKLKIIDASEDDYVTPAYLKE